MSSGLMKPTPKEDDLLNSIRRAFGPASSTPLTLEQKLKGLSENELNLVLTTAQLVKMITGMRVGKAEPYLQVVNRTYPRLNSRIRSIIAEVLQDADPISEEEIAAPVGKSRDAIVDDFYSQWDQQQPSSEASVETQQEPQTGNDDFLARLTQSESSGNSQAEITIKDGRKFVGKLQFGEARLADYKKATGSSFTQDEFQADPDLQDEVAQWHFKDIDKAIDALGDAAKGYDRDGLRSVAHLGGKGGMQKFVKSGGRYNPADELGTSLKAYYDKHSSGGGA